MKGDWRAGQESGAAGHSQSPATGTVCLGHTLPRATQPLVAQPCTAGLLSPLQPPEVTSDWPPALPTSHQTQALVGHQFGPAQPHRGQGKSCCPLQLPCSLEVLQSRQSVWMLGCQKQSVSTIAFSNLGSGNITFYR